MFYIPVKWLKNSTNMNIVHDILNRYLFSDLVSESVDKTNEAIQELENIGETTVIERIKDGSIAIN